MRLFFFSPPGVGLLATAFFFLQFFSLPLRLHLIIFPAPPVVDEIR